MKINPKLLEVLQSRNIPLDFIHNQKEKAPVNRYEENQKIKIRPVSNTQSLTQSTNFLSQTTATSRIKEESVPKEFKDLDDFEKFEIINEINEFFLQDEITIKNLSEISLVPQDDLHEQKKLNFQVDLSLNSLQNLGYICPSLLQLKLNGSIIKSLRDIGTSLQKLQVLHVSRCQINDLSGIHALPNLQELYASFNSIVDLSGLNFHQQLYILDLEGNEISEYQQIDVFFQFQNLSTLKIKILNLSGNPITKIQDYRVTVLQKLNLEILDEVDSQNLLMDNTLDFKPLEDIDDKLKNLFIENLNEEDLITQSIKFFNKNPKQSIQNETQNNFMNHTFLNTVKSNSSNNKKKNRYLNNPRYLEQILSNDSDKQIVASDLNKDFAISGNPTKAIKKQKQKIQQQDILQQIQEQKNKNNLSMCSLSDFDENFVDNEKINKSMQQEVNDIEPKQEALRTLRVSSTKRISFNKKTSITGAIQQDALKPLEKTEKFSLNLSKKFSLKKESFECDIKQDINDQNSIIKSKFGALRFGSITKKDILKIPSERKQIKDIQFQKDMQINPTTENIKLFKESSDNINWNQLQNRPVIKMPKLRLTNKFNNE